MAAKQYRIEIDLGDPNRSHTKLITWTGHGKRVLDVGCATGAVGLALHRDFGCAVVGIEFDAGSAAACQGYERVVVGSAEDPSLIHSLDDHFDVILFGDVLEHLRRPEIALRGLRQWLRPGGCALVSLPNIAHLRHRLWLAAGKWEYTEEGIMDRTHLRYFTLASARRLFAECGWRETRFDFVVGRRMAALKRFLPPTLFAAQFVFQLESLSTNVKRTNE